MHAAKSPHEGIVRVELIDPNQKFHLKKQPNQTVLFIINSSESNGLEGKGLRRYSSIHKHKAEGRDLLAFGFFCFLAPAYFFDCFV